MGKKSQILNFCLNSMTDVKITLKRFLRNKARTGVSV